MHTSLNKYLEKTQRIAGKNIFFIVGTEKSGTTWLQMLLDCHPQAVCKGEGQIATVLWPAIRKGLDEYSAFVGELNQKVFKEIDQFPLFSEESIRAIQAFSAALLLSEYGDDERILAIGEKTPGHLRTLDSLKLHFPEAKFIIIYRDGRDIAVSGWYHMKRQYGEDKADTLPAYAKYIAALWRDDYEKAVAFAEQYPGDCAHVRYEDLHEDPVAALIKLFDFLGLDSSTELIVQCVEACNFDKLAGGRERGQENVQSHFRKGIVGDWRNHFDHATWAMFDAEAGELLGKLGYQREWEAPLIVATAPNQTEQASSASEEKHNRNIAGSSLGAPMQLAGTMSDSKLPTIFVSIASYRDPDCQNTVHDLFEKAACPERITIGLCLQIVPGEDEDCLVSTERHQQLRLIEVHASESRGACWARSRVQELWHGEDYFFQVDSHMRFVPGWDEKLIAMLEKCPGDKPVISTYPLEFTPPDTFAPHELVTIRPKGFDDDGILAQNSTLSPLDKAPEHPVPSPFISAGMLFAAGRIVDEVPYDPYLYFTGEEITLGARLWTSGWDIYCPNEVIAYHNYSKQIERPRHWVDQTDWVDLGRRSHRRTRHILGMEVINNDSADLVGIERYGLGSVRTLAEYEVFSGLDFKGHLFKGQPLPLPELMADQPGQAVSRRRVFSGIWKDNFWGDTETRSGSGSSMAATVSLRAWLLKMLNSLGVRILGDAGCGDLNWMKELTGSLQFYFGFDIVPELVDDLRSRFKDRPNCFFSEADVVTATFPECDAILCRDCLTHLTPDSALMALKGFRRSGSRFLIATTHSIGRNVWVNTGGWYSMDMTAAPFNLPPPLFTFSEGGTKSLAVWSTADLPE